MPRPRSDIEPRIVAAATQRFLREGVDGASLRAIAKDAGTSLGMVYYYYPSKDDLFLAVVEEKYGALLADFAVALAPGRPPDERLRAMFETVARIDEAQFAVLRIVVREALVSSSRLHRLVERFKRGHVPMVLATLRDGIAEGVFDPTIPLPSLVLSTAGLLALPQLVLKLLRWEAPDLAPLVPDPQRVATDALKVLLRGAAPPAGRDDPRGA